MSWILFSVCLSITTPLYAQNPTDTQLLKAFGYYPDISLNALDSVPLRAISAQHSSLNLVQNRFCDHPDHPDREIANSTPEILSQRIAFPVDFCERLIQAHKRMLEATGRGSWPPACINEFPDNHAIYYYVDEDSFPSHMKRPVTPQEIQQIVDANTWNVTLQEARQKWADQPMLSVALNLVDEAYRRVGCAHIRVQSHDEKHHVHIRSRPIPGSTIGIAWFNNGTCGDHVDHHIDSTWRPSLHALCNLLCHEFGHNHNLPHIFSGQDRHHSIMSYSPRYPFQGFRTGEEGNHNYGKDPSHDQLARQYGGEPVPIDPINPDPPIPPITPSGDLPSVGDEILLLFSNRQFTTTVTKVEGDEGPNLADRIAKAVTNIEDYPQKQQHKQALIMIYSATAQAVESNQITIEQGKSSLQLLRSLLIPSNHQQKWKEIFNLADSITTKEGFSSVAEGITRGEFLSPEIVAAIRLIVELLPEGRLKTIVNIILTILEIVPTDNQNQNQNTDQKVGLREIFRSNRGTSFVVGPTYTLAN